uniref:Uncharacterized protein n=1 Tax=Anguilla anguilla TaxID=7936 RepID=A0A0E9RIA9_ANGAN
MATFRPYAYSNMPPSVCVLSTIALKDKRHCGLYNSLV